jgi:hypothetical protein
MTKFISWPEIDNFHTLRRTLRKYPELLGPSTNVEYRAKVKLHGTNAGVRIDADGTVTAFSRTSVITPKADNAGFARWVEDRKELFAKMTSAKRGDIVIHGEWCGPGVQKGVAVCQIPEKIFAVFAVRFLEGDGDVQEHEPTELECFVHDVPGAHVIPWYRDAEIIAAVDWSAPSEDLAGVVESINRHVVDVETCDPWVEKAFNVKGVGEGLVFYPCRPHNGHNFFKNLAFKAKGEKHTVVARTRPAQVDPTVAANIDAFAELVVTPARLEQGARAVANGELVFDNKNIGQFLKWINTDVAKETSAELEASGLDQRLAAKACSNRARDWYVRQCMKL